MYFGYFEHHLDEKGRLLLPKKIKESLKEGETIYVLKGFEGCLAVYDEAEFNKLCSECENISYTKKNSRDYLRVVLGSVIALSLDKVGRIQIPSLTLSKYQIGKNVVILGVRDHFEIWDMEAYQKYEADINDNFEQIAESLNKDEKRD